MKFRVLFAALMGFGLLGNTVFAQRVKRPAKITVELKDTKNVKTELIKVPDIGGSKLKGNTKLTRERWLRLYKTIKLKSQDTKAKWVDNLEITWKIYLPPVLSGEAKRKAILLDKSVVYCEAPLNKELPISLFFRPLFIERYMKGSGFKTAEIAVSMEFKVNGAEVKGTDGKVNFEMTCGGKPVKRSVWGYDDNKLHTLENAEMAVLDKTETPFNNIGTSEFLTIKKED